MVILKIIYIAAIVIMLGSVVVFGYGHLSQDPSYMDRAADWGLIGAIVTVVLTFVRRLIASPRAQGIQTQTTSGQ